MRIVNDAPGTATATVASADVTAGDSLEVVRHCVASLACMAEPIRTFGDPVLKTKAAPVADVDGKARRLVDKMFGALYGTDNGLALAAPQIGVQKQVVVWDFGEDPKTIFNPEIVESDGEWVYEEGCLSIPGLYVEIVRPKTVLVRGVDARRQPGGVGGRRGRGPHVPARARPPQRRADVRPHDARAAP